MSNLQSLLLEAGCKNAAQASMCALVYLDLTEVKKYFNVSYKYNEQIDKLYFLGQRSKNSELAAFLPIPCNESINFDLMQKYLTYLCIGDIKKLYLIICAADSTNVYYEISEGITTNAANEKNKIENKRESIDKVLERNWSLLAEAAMCNVPISIKSKETPSVSGKREKTNNNY